MENALIIDQEVDVANKIASSDRTSYQLLTIKQFCFAFPWPSESAMRAYVYRAKELGIESAFVKFQRRVLVRPAIFFLLIQQINSRSNQGGLNEAANNQKRGACL